MSHHNEFEWEPIPGIPAPLPKGEHILWQGSPQWYALAVSAFHVRKLALYFAIIVVFQFSSAWSNGASNEVLMAGPALTLLLASAAIIILCALAWLSANATIYTLTNKRILIRFGIAIQLTINLPFKQIRAANIQSSRSGIGNIPLELTANAKRVSYIVMWPHTRQWYFSRPQPMLRAIANAEDVAHKIGQAANAAIGGHLLVGNTEPVSSPRSQAMPGHIHQPDLSLEK